MSSGRRPIIALLVVLGAAGLNTLWMRGRGGAGIDFYQMWVGARLAREAGPFYAPATSTRGGEEYLRRAETEERSPRRLAVARHRRSLELMSTPFLFMLYAPFGGTYERDFLLFQLFETASLIAAIMLLTRTYRLGAPLGLALFALVTGAFAPAASNLRVANVLFLVLLLIAAAVALAMKQRFLACGVVLALAALAKPYLAVTFLLLYAFWIVKRRWRDLGAHAAGAAIAGIAGCLASTLYYRTPTIWLDWLRALRAMPPSMVPIELGNFALVRIVEDLWGLHTATLVLAVGLAAAVFMAWRSNTSTRHADVLAIGVGCILALLTSPLVWVHYLMLTLPLLAYLLRPAEENETDSGARTRQLAAALALLLFAIEPWERFVPETMQLAALVNVGLILAFVAGLYDLRAPRTA